MYSALYKSIFIYSIYPDDISTRTRLTTSTTAITSSPSDSTTPDTSTTSTRTRTTLPTYSPTCLAEEKEL